MCNYNKICEILHYDKKRFIYIKKRRYRKRKKGINKKKKKKLMKVYSHLKYLYQIYDVKSFLQQKDGFYILEGWIPKSFNFKKNAYSFEYS